MNRSRTLVLDRPLDLRMTLGLNCRGRGDPTMRISDTEVVRATRNPDGPVSLHLVQRAGEVVATAWGPGAERALDDLPDLLGEGDVPVQFGAEYPVVRELEKRCAGLRIGRTGAVIEALVPAILEQKITGAEARRVYRSMVLSFGEPAPGPLGLHVPPTPSALTEIPYWSFHRIGLERRRAEVIRNACRQAGRLEATCLLERPAAYRTLQALPGVGPWTAAEVGARAYGDPDAVSVGDFHLPHLVSWALAGEPRGSDDRMLELLVPYEGQRGRVIRMIETTAARRPRVVPRPSVRSIAGF